MHDLIAAHHTNDLDNPAYAALTSVHSRFAQRNGSALRYIPATVRFLALPTSPSPADWRDAAELVEPDGPLAIIGARCEPPQDWRIIRQFDVVQMLEHDITGTEHPGAVSLSPADVPEMLELVRLTNPGPFDDRTVELGDYVGVRDADALVAMAGERLRFTGWT